MPLSNSLFKLNCKGPNISYPGQRVSTVVTDVSVFKKTDGCDLFILTAHMPFEPDEGEAACIQRVKENIGWNLKVAPKLERMNLPGNDTLTLLRPFDPVGYFIGS